MVVSASLASLPPLLSYCVESVPLVSVLLLLNQLKGLYQWLVLVPVLLLPVLPPSQVGRLLFKLAAKFSVALRPLA